MTTISIVASGTRGDVQPYIALGSGLRNAGHEVRLLASENFGGLASEAGLEFRSTGENIEEILQNDEWRKVTESGNFIAILSRMQQEQKRHASRMAKALPGLLKGSKLIVTGMGGIGGTFSVAESLDIPLVLAFVFPFTPTSEFPGPLVPRLPVGGILNRLSFHIIRQMFWQTSKSGDLETRKILGMSNAPFWGPYRSLASRQVPALYGYSRHVLPRPQDWPKNHAVTGYWFLDEPQGWTPPKDLSTFLNAGPPPVYIGFGSMGSRNPQEAGEIALNALAKSGQRGVLATGWGGLRPSDVPSTVYLVSALPHSWLFPRMAAVVHHGGAGTTAAGLRAGVPSITVPFMGDQPFWGKRISDLGVGPTPIPRKRLTGQRLADAIISCTSDKQMRDRAMALSEKIRAENGIGTAVAAIQQIIE